MYPALPSHSPRPGSANSGGHGMHHNMMDIGPSTSVMPTMDVASKNSVLGMSLNMGPEMMPSTGRGSQPPPSHPIQPQSHSRQSSMPPQFPSVPPQAVPLGQQHMRQGSLPPSAAMLNNVPVKNEMRSSVPPAPVLPGGSGSVSQGAPGPMPSIATAPPTNQGPPLPAGANPATTKITLVPLAESLVNIPDLSEEEVKNIHAWMKTDQEYDAVLRKTKERMAAEMVEIFGPRTLPWWEKGSLDATMHRSRKGRENFDIRYPRKPKDPSQRRKGARREGLKLPQRLNSEDVSKPEQLVPIRLEFDVEHHKMRDTFVWNLNDPIVTPEHFAQTLIEDYNLAPSYHAIITKSIQDQLSDYKAHTVNYDGDDSDAVVVQADTTLEDVALKGKLDDENSAWWEAWRKRLRAEYLESTKQSAGKSKKRRKCADEKLKEKPMTIDEFDIDEQALNEEMRILIKLDVVVGSMKLDDQFEWDLDNTHASPEEFADVYAQDLGLGGEFKTAIAHSIREQVQGYQKSLFLVGHPSDGTTIQDEELRSSFLPILTSGARSLDQVQSYTPLLNLLSDGEIERSEREREKDMVKRRKRNTRGRRGIALPDREPIRTYRTPAIGFPELDPAILALAAAASAPSRRAAAAAASVTIANMVASENGVPFMPQPLPSAPQQPPPQVSKEKKVNGFFKAPLVPQSALRPRAHVAAPTPSTATDITKLPAPLEDDPPPAIRALPDNKITKVISAKRQKELEREAKEKEYVDGQHPNFIDGVWHCSNCGCPESIAIGRRKGPLGDKSQCGTCGKYWHRHRRPRPVEYTPDPDYHSGLRRDTEIAKSASKKKGRGQLFAVAAEASEPQTPSRSNGDVENTSRAQTPLPSIPADDDRAISPVSTASSSSEPPLSQKVKVNGTSHANIYRNAAVKPCQGMGKRSRIPLADY
ncbi:SNF5 / SMARCB1 / INI1 domain containing protein [Amanita muscaria]